MYSLISSLLKVQPLFFLFHVTLHFTFFITPFQIITSRAMEAKSERHFLVDLVCNPRHETSPAFDLPSVFFAALSVGCTPWSVCDFILQVRFFFAQRV